LADRQNPVASCRRNWISIPLSGVTAIDGQTKSSCKLQKKLDFSLLVSGVTAIDGQTKSSCKLQKKLDFHSLPWCNRYWRTDKVQLQVAVEIGFPGFLLFATDSQTDRLCFEPTHASYVSVSRRGDLFERVVVIRASASRGLWVRSRGTFSELSCCKTSQNQIQERQIYNLCDALRPDPRRFQI
jgi:hypothetical protein